MTLAQLQTIISYAISCHGSDQQLHVQFLSDQLPSLNNLDDGYVNDVAISKPFGEGEKILMSIELP